MTGYAVAHLDDIDELSDGRCPWRPVRHHLGITSFGVNAWTARHAGDRIINEHVEDEREPGHLQADELEDDSSEELYLVHRGRARFEPDSESVDAPAGTFVFVPPRVKRTAFAEEPGTTVVAFGGIPGKAYEPAGWEIWRQFHQLYESGEYAEVADRRTRADRGQPVRGAALQPRVLREPRGPDVRRDRPPPTRPRPDGAVP
jgi:hypothetical protein